MTVPTAVRPAARRPSATVARILQPVLVAALVAVVSAITVATLIRGVFVTGGSIGLVLLVLLVLPAATAVLALGLGFLFRWLGTRSHWAAAIVLAIVVLGVYVALLFTGTQRPSIVTLGVEVMIVAVSLAAGAASAFLLGGRWRLLGFAGVIGLLWLAITPVLVAL